MTSTSTRMAIRRRIPTVPVTRLQTMSLHSPLESRHLALGAAMTEFAGWHLPVRYTSDLAEHQAVRTKAGVFDLSHMGEIVVVGPSAADALDHSLVGWMSRVGVGDAKYTMICAEDGGIIDDLVVYRLESEEYMVVANAGNVSVVAGELRDRCRAFDCEVRDRSTETALIAVQGPQALAITERLVEVEGTSAVAGMKYYSSVPSSFGGTPMTIARTGYTGEDGFEFFCASDRAEDLWNRIMAAGEDGAMVPCGLASRDTLRLEAGMPLYGHELTLDRTPFEAGLGRVVHFGTEGEPRLEFVGRQALEAASERVKGWRDSPESSPDDARLLVGLVGEGRRSPRTGYPVEVDGQEAGEVTSGAPSPTLGCPVAMAYVHPRHAFPGMSVDVDVRGRREKMIVSALPFYSRAK